MAELDVFQNNDLQARPAFPVRKREPPLEETDANGDVIFRFTLDAPDERLTLLELYRRQIRDLLGVVRLYSGGRPVIPDSFAFLNDTNERHPILE